MLSLTTASLFFAGLSAAALPVLLHLLMQGKPKLIEFPAVMFIAKKIETHRRNYQLKHILLLVLRILLFTLLGLALARPLIKLGTLFSPPADGNAVRTEDLVSNLVTSLGSQDAPIAAAIVVDTSLRMNYTAENKTRLEIAQEFAHWILKQLPKNSNVAVLGCEPENVAFQIDPIAAKEKIDRLRITAQGRPVIEAVQNAAALLQESTLEQRELYVLSDLTLPGWDVQTVSEALKNFTETSGGGLFVVDVGAKDSKNSAFRKLSIAPEIPISGSPLQFEVQTAHSGPATTKTVELVLIGNAQDPLAETVRMSKTIDFPEGESQRSLPMVLTTGFATGTYQGKLRFSSGDALPMDDQSWFTLSVQPPQKILIFAQPPVRDSALYLRQAWETVPFTVDTAPISELSGKTLKELQEYQAIVLLDPSSLTQSTWKKLGDYASAGYGIGIFLGPHADSLLSFNDPTATEILGAKLVREARNPEGELWIMPGVSPIFSPFRSMFPALDQVPWNVQSVYRYWELGELSARADVAGQFSDNRPAIITQTLGRGRTVLVTTPVSESSEVAVPWNNLPHSEANWMFLLLAEGLGKHLVGMSNQKSNFNIGEPVVIRPNTPTLPVSCLLGTPQGKSERLTPDPVRREIVIPQTTEPGNYTVRAGGVGQAALDLGFSVNIPPGVTSLQRVETSVLDRHFGANNYQLVRTPQEIERSIARRRIGQEMYASIMLLLAIIFGAEYIFANRIYKA